MSPSTQRAYALLLILLAPILIYRAIDLFAEGAPRVWMPWVTALLWLEVLLLAATVTVAVLWLVRPGAGWQRRTLYVFTALVLVHALRVSVFALGRIGPMVDFDVRPEHRALHGERWTWADVYLASGMAAISLVVLALIWARWRRS